MRNLVLLFTLFILFLSGCTQTSNEQSVTESKFKDKVDSLLSMMTLEEKLGQLNLPGSDDILTGQASNTDIAGKIRNGEVGGLFNIKTASKIREVQRIAVEESRMKIPLIFGMDVIHGYQTVFPIPLALSCSWNMDLIERTAQIAAIESTADGICWTFSPMVDISRDPRWGRVAEGGGEDPYLGSEIAKAMVRGYQGQDLADPKTMMACVKHFALYGASEAGRDYNTVDMSRIRMFNEYMSPYKAAIDAGAGSIMTSFNEIDGIPASANKWLVTDLLRKQWGFEGFVVTDYTAINEMIDHGLGDFETVSALALQAGVDMDMVGEGFLNTLQKSLKEGKITEKQIDEACRRILVAKYQLGLFDDPYRYCDPERAAHDIFTEEFRNEAREIASQTFVLLKNEDQLLPLKRRGTIALIGPLANNRENMDGTWSVAGKFDQAVSLKEGMEQVAGDGVTVLYAKGANIFKDPEMEARVSVFDKDTHRDPRSEAELLKEAVDIAKKADVIVAAIGEASEMSGESSSRSSIDIPATQRKLLQALIETGKPVAVVLFTGRPLTIEWESENVTSLLNVWFAGSEAGYAIADVLFGQVNPSGKLTMTFPKNVGQIPIYYNHKNTGRPLPKGVAYQKFRSGYMDVSNEPLYPFGYGLSYTTFTYSNLEQSSNSISGEEYLDLRVQLENTGMYDGSEVVQLYIQDTSGSVTRPVKELKQFQKVFLKAGEKKTIQFSINRDDLKFYNYDLAFVNEPGKYNFWIGGNSQEGLMGEFQWAD